MKKVFLTISMVVMVMAVQAQSSRVRMKLKEGEVPVVVVTSFNTDYNGVAVDEWSRIPVKVLEQEYEVTGYDDLNGQAPDFYAVKIKGTNMKGEAVYDKDGKLLHSKEWTKDTLLPAAVTKAIMAKYPGYAFLKDQEIIRGGKKEFVHYRVTIEKGKEKRVVATDESGKILHDRKAL